MIRIGLYHEIQSARSGLTDGLRVKCERGYGLFAANIFGVRAFEHNSSLDGSMRLKPGDSVRFRYRVVIHPGDYRSAPVAELYDQYAGTP